MNPRIFSIMEEKKEEELKMLEDKIKRLKEKYEQQKKNIILKYENIQK